MFSSVYRKLGWMVFYVSNPDCHKFCHKYIRILPVISSQIWHGPGGKRFFCSVYVLCSVNLWYLYVTFFKSKWEWENENYISKYLWTRRRNTRLWNWWWWSGLFSIPVNQQSRTRTTKTSCGSLYYSIFHKLNLLANGINKLLTFT